MRSTFEEYPRHVVVSWNYFDFPTIGSMIFHVPSQKLRRDDFLVLISRIIWWETWLGMINSFLLYFLKTPLLHLTTWLFSAVLWVPTFLALIWQWTVDRWNFIRILRSESQPISIYWIPVLKMSLHFTKKILSPGLSFLFFIMCSYPERELIRPEIFWNNRRVRYFWNTKQNTNLTPV